MMTMKLRIIFLVLILAADKPNDLLIAVDDLNDWIGKLGGHPQFVKKG